MLQGLYEAVHASLIETLMEMGIAATKFDGPRMAGEQPFLCFERREPGDVIAGGCKIGGSAQRRQRGAVLQHGSVLLGQSQFAPELTGIRELFGAEVNIEMLSPGVVAAAGRSIERGYFGVDGSGFDRPPGKGNRTEKIR